MNLNLPNALTILRIALIPIIVLLFTSGDDYSRFLAFILFLIASITDYLDGLLARYMKQQTNFGEFLDPIANFCKSLSNSYDQKLSGYNYQCRNKKKNILIFRNQ